MTRAHVLAAGMLFLAVRDVLSLVSSVAQLALSGWWPLWLWLVACLWVSGTGAAALLTGGHRRGRRLVLLYAAMQVGPEAYLAVRDPIAVSFLQVVVCVVLVWTAWRPLPDRPPDQNTA